MPSAMRSSWTRFTTRRKPWNSRSNSTKRNTNRSHPTNTRFRHRGKPMYWAFLILRYMHILGAIALMGSAIFMRFALAPSLKVLPDEQQKNMHEAIRARWGMFVRGATLLLLISGLANLIMYPA